MSLPVVFKDLIKNYVNFQRFHCYVSFLYMNLEVDTVQFHPRVITKKHHYYHINGVSAAPSTMTPFNLVFQLTFSILDI